MKGEFLEGDFHELKLLPGSTASIEKLKVRVTNGGGVVLLMDGSRSMASKMEQAKNGATKLASQVIENGTAVGVAVFHTNTALLTETTFDLNEVKGAIEAIESRGTTNMSAGLLLANLVLGEHSPRTIVLVTDGRPDDRDKAVFAADLARVRDIEIVCIGVDGADMTLLQLIATVPDMAMHIDSVNLEKAIVASFKLLRLNGKK